MTGNSPATRSTPLGRLGLRRLGEGGPLLSRLGVGLAALGRPAYHTLAHDADFPAGRSPEQMEERAHAVLDAAYAAGIRYVDAARSYGRAEHFLRSWLERRPVGRELVVGSKWGYRYVGDWRVDAAQHEVKDHSLAALRAQVAESRANLGPWLAVYHVHSLTPDSPLLGDAAVLDELARLRDEGLRIGVTVSGPSQAEMVRRALAVERGGAPLFTDFMATWNLLERSAGDALREAHEAGRGVIVKEPLANGRLGPRSDAARAGPLAAAAREAGATPDAIALAAALSQPWADVVLTGAVTVDQLQSNLGAIDLLNGRGELPELDDLREEPEPYWRARAALPWR